MQPQPHHTHPRNNYAVQSMVRDLALEIFHNCDPLADKLTSVIRELSRRYGFDPAYVSYVLRFQRDLWQDCADKREIDALVVWVSRWEERPTAIPYVTLALPSLEKELQVTQLIAILARCAYREFLPAARNVVLGTSWTFRHRSRKILMAQYDDDNPSEQEAFHFAANQFYDCVTNSLAFLLDREWLCGLMKCIETYDPEEKLESLEHLSLWERARTWLGKSWLRFLFMKGF